MHKKNRSLNGAEAIREGLIEVGKKIKTLFLWQKVLMTLHLYLVQQKI